MEEVRFTILSFVKAVCKAKLSERVNYRQGYNIDVVMAIC